MELQVRGRRFEIVVASDVIRDGLGVELWESGGEPGPLLEVLRQGPQGEVTLTVHTGRALPMEVVREVLTFAEERLSDGRR